jgi:hypothetical protein
MQTPYTRGGVECLLIFLRNVAARSPEGPTAGPSTSLRYGRDDNSFVTLTFVTHQENCKSLGFAPDEQTDSRSRLDAGRANSRSLRYAPPDFLLSVVVLANFMRLSLLKGAHGVLSSVAWQEIRVRSGRDDNSFVILTFSTINLAMFNQAVTRRDESGCS